jgi:hypothetical protein
VDDSRFGHRMPTRAAAVRELLKLGLTVNGADGGRMKSSSYGFADDRSCPLRSRISEFGIGQMVPRKGLEPSRPLSHWHLKPARLPIPPPGPGRVSKVRSRACQTASTASE